MEHGVLRHTCSSGRESCSEASVHTYLITRTRKCEDSLQCVVLLCFVYCDVVLMYYSHVLNKVSCYTVLVESCCDALQSYELKREKRKHMHIISARVGQPATQFQDKLILLDYVNLYLTFQSVRCFFYKHETAFCYYLHTQLY